MRKLLILLLLFISFFNLAQASVSITSVLDEKTINYLPEEGQIIKRGEYLVKMKTTPIDNEIERAKLDISYADINLKDKEKNYKRCSYLKNNNSTSPEDCENSELAYETAKAKVEECKAELDYLENKKAKAFITAPYDFKVTKVLLSVGSGVKYGTQILEIEKI